MKCKNCGGRATKALYRLMPVKICVEGTGNDPKQCNLVWTDNKFVRFLMVRLPYHGWFYPYKCSYPKALILKITGRIEYE